MIQETGNELEYAPCVLLDVDAFGKVQLHSASIRSWKLEPPKLAVTSLQKGAVRAVIAPEHVALVFSELGWRKEDIVVGAHLLKEDEPVPDIGKTEEEGDNGED